MAGRLIAAALPLALGGCLLVLSDKLDGLADGATDGGRFGDASMSETSSGSTTSGAPGEAGTKPDGAGEAGPAVPFCATQPDAVLCDDFDDATKPLASYWPQRYLEN